MSSSKERLRYCKRGAAAGKVKSPAGTAALEDYNFAVGRILSAMHHGGLAPWREPALLSGGWTLSTRLHSPRQFNPADFDFEPADEFKVEGSYVDWCPTGIRTLTERSRNESSRPATAPSKIRRPWKR